MTGARIVLAGAGLALATYGGWLVLDRQDPGQLLEIAVWLVAGVVVHDVFVAGTSGIAARVVRRVLPGSWVTPATLGLVVWASVTLVAIPVLGRFGARPDNPTLLDRPYLPAWLALTAMTMLGIAVAGLVRGRRGSPPEPEA